MEIIAVIVAISETIFAVVDEAEDSTKAFNQAEETTEINRTKVNGTPTTACLNRQPALLSTFHQLPAFKVSLNQGKQINELTVVLYMMLSLTSVLKQ